MDFKLCSSWGCINQGISNSLQLDLLGLYDHFQIYFCFCESKTITKIDNFDKITVLSDNCCSFSCINFGYEIDRNLYGINFLWSLFFSDVWAFLCLAIWIRSLSNLRIRFKFFDVWSIGRRLNFNGGWLFDELVHTNNALLFSIFLCHFIVLELSTNNKHSFERILNW